MHVDVFTAQMRGEQENVNCRSLDSGNSGCHLSYTSYKVVFRQP